MSDLLLPYALFFGFDLKANSQLLCLIFDSDSFLLCFVLKSLPFKFSLVFETLSLLLSFILQSSSLGFNPLLFSKEISFIFLASKLLGFKSFPLSLSFFLCNFLS